MFFLIIYGRNNCFSQCINTFPNTQDFESAAVWTSGGTNSDWAWGSPSKPVINAAGSGSKCWIIGGLSNTTYNGSQQSFIESPCYDFSSLTCPAISFKVFWEMEFKYDGAGLQYSTNNGSSWLSVGGFNDPANCMTKNWYNYSNINYLTSNSKEGWSGNGKSTSGGCQGGSGSLGWVTAKHCVGNLAGKPNVKFRFVFGSGSTCNSFDGFAIDDFTVENVNIAASGFTNTCSNFTAIDTSCIALSSFQWNFGDPSSGINNTSTQKNPAHIFSNPGTYSVALTASIGACNTTTSFTKTVNVLGTQIGPVSNVSCKGGKDGSATVLTLFGNSGYSYTWSPEGGHAASAYSLTAGNYSVTVSDNNGCIHSSTVDITEPNPNTGSSSQTITGCFGDQTHLEVLTQGITDPVSYLWSPGSYTTSSIDVSPSVTTVYSVIVSVSGTCALNELKLFTAAVVPKPVILFNASALKGCAPLCIDLTDKSLSPGATITDYEWIFSNGIINKIKNPTICFPSPGIYTGSYGLANSLGCKTQLNNAITLTVLPAPVAAFTADRFHLSELEEKVNFTNESSTDVVKWDWNFGGMAASDNTNPSYKFDMAGEFPVILTVTNSYGCTSTLTHDIKVFPEFTFFAPDAFSPNADNLNDVFLPKGNGWQTASYKLWIFNRWGEKIFHTTDPLTGWNGKDAADNTYIWKVELTDVNKKEYSFNGVVTILR